MARRHSTITFRLDGFAADLPRPAPRFHDLLRRKNFPPYFASHLSHLILDKKTGNLGAS